MYRDKFNYKIILCFSYDHVLVIFAFHYRPKSCIYEIMYLINVYWDNMWFFAGNVEYIITSIIINTIIVCM